MPPTSNESAEASPETANDIEVVADAADAGERLDRVLVRHAAGALNRSRIQALIRDGFVSGIDGPVVSPAAKVAAGAVYRIVVPPPAPAEPQPETMPLAVVYEDKHLIVIDKPAGLVVHPAAGHAEGTLVNALIAHCGETLSGIGGVRRPGIVHRLDKDTSGLLVVAKTDAAHQGLAEQFASHGHDGRLVRSYRALVWSRPPRPRGKIDAPLARATANRKKIAVSTAETARRAVTHYEVLESYGASGKREPVASLVAARLETGRTHQIRVHFAHIGHPLLGDTTYGAGFKSSAAKLHPRARARLAELGRQALHAAELGFEHPATGKRLHFTSPIPSDMAALIAALSDDD